MDSRDQAVRRVLQSFADMGASLNDIIVEADRLRTDDYYLYSWDKTIVPNLKLKAAEVPSKASFLSRFWWTFKKAVGLRP